METLGVIIGESLFQHLRLQNVKIAKGWQQTQIFDPTRELHVDISGKTHHVRLRFNDRHINSQTIGLFMKKSGKKKEAFVLESESLASFRNTSFSSRRDLAEYTYPCRDK